MPIRNEKRCIRSLDSENASTYLVIDLRYYIAFSFPATSIYEGISIKDGNETSGEPVKTNF